jgi:hypothetical protein
MVSFELSGDAVEAISARLNGWFALGDEERERTRQHLSATAASRWSWEGVARGIVEASGGNLDRLPAVPDQ